MASSGKVAGHKAAHLLQQVDSFDRQAHTDMSAAATASQPVYGLECKAVWCERILSGKLQVAACRCAEGLQMRSSFFGFAALGSWRPSSQVPNPPGSPVRAGEKSIEVRAYPPPPEMAGQRVLLLASEGDEGVATFGGAIEPGQHGGSVVGWVLFDSAAVEYTSCAAFTADAALHCVPPGSPYAFQEGSPPLFGWRVVASHRNAAPQPLPAMQRVVRSVYKRRT